MTISSPDFENLSAIPARFTCEGENINPAIRIEGVPEAAASLALVMEDPDAPSGTFLHWAAYDILPDTKDILTGMEPPGVGLLNGASKPGYTGPCPPSGTHRYFFRLYALDKMLTDSKISNREDLENAMEGHIMETAELMGTYWKTNR